MRRVLIVVGVLAGLILLLAGVGALMPQGHVASRTVQLRHPPEVVWRTITDVAAFPAWRPGVTHAEVVPGALHGLAWREVVDGDTVLYNADEEEPPRRLVTRIATPGLPYGGTWTYDLAPTPAGTALTVTERGEVYNPIFRVVARVAMDPHATMDAYLAALAARLDRAAAAR